MYSNIFYSTNIQLGCLWNVTKNFRLRVLFFYIYIIILKIEMNRFFIYIAIFMYFIRFLPCYFSFFVVSIKWFTLLFKYLYVKIKLKNVALAWQRRNCYMQDIFHKCNWENYSNSSRHNLIVDFMALDLKQRSRI